MLNPARTLAIAGLLLAPLAVASPASASTDGTRVVISEVYGAGGTAAPCTTATSSSSTTRPTRR